MRVLAATLVACLGLASGCASEEFTGQELLFATRQVEVTVENRSASVVMLLFTGTMGGLELVQPGVTQSFRFDSPPPPWGEPPPRPPFRDEPESWSLDLGRPILNAQGHALGIRQPVWNVARAQEPFVDGLARVFVRVDAAGATWRRLSQ